MTTLHLTHTPAEGTLLDGTSRGDASAAALKAARQAGGGNWRWSRELDQWYIRQSRDRRVYTGQIEVTRKHLEAAGFDVVVELGDERRPVAEQEADRAQRSENRTARLEGRAATLKASGEAGWKAAREYADLIPFGQPILVGHHSEGRHRRLLAKIDNMDRKAIDQLKEGESAEQRAAAAAANQRHREHGATTMRRLEKLRADRRRVQRGMEQTHGWDQQPLNEEQLERIRAHYQPQAEDLDEKIAYWEEYLRGLAEAGVYRVWTREDFTRGDFVLNRYGWAEVKRVNAKSLTIPHIHDVLAEHGHTWSLPYDEVRGRRSAEEHAAATAPQTATA